MDNPYICWLNLQKFSVIFQIKDLLRQNFLILTAQHIIFYINQQNNEFLFPLDGKNERAGLGRFHKPADWALSFSDNKQRKIEQHRNINTAEKTQLHLKWKCFQNYIKDKLVHTWNLVQVARHWSNYWGYQFQKERVEWKIGNSIDISFGK